MIELATNWLEWQMLNKFSCIALAGVATEYLLYGYAEGGLADVNKVLGISLPLFYIERHSITA